MIFMFLIDQCKDLDATDPRQGPEPPFAGKEGFGFQKTHFPSPLKGLEREFSAPKIPIFHVFPCRKKGDFLTENSLFQNEGKWGHRTPVTLFSRKWGFGPLSGVGGIPMQRSGSWFAEFLENSRSRREG